jgi:hypothetical protein
MYTILLQNMLINCKYPFKNQKPDSSFRNQAFVSSFINFYLNTEQNTIFRKKNPVGTIIVMIVVLVLHGRKCKRFLELTQHLTNKFSNPSLFGIAPHAVHCSVFRCLA